MEHLKLKLLGRQPIFRKVNKKTKARGGLTLQDGLGILENQQTLRQRVIRSNKIWIVWRSKKINKVKALITVLRMIIPNLQWPKEQQMTRDSLPQNINLTLRKKCLRAWIKTIVKIQKSLSMRFRLSRLPKEIKIALAKFKIQNRLQKKKVWICLNLDQVQAMKRRLKSDPITKTSKFAMSTQTLMRLCSTKDSWTLNLDFWKTRETTTSWIMVVTKVIKQWADKWSAKESLLRMT